MPRRNELIIRCQQPHHHLFCAGVIEEQPGQWIMKQALEVEDSIVDCIGPQQPIDGKLSLGDSYRGCPYCGASGIVVCGVCGKITCWQRNEFQCAWCGTKADVAGGIEKFHAGGV